MKRNQDEKEVYSRLPLCKKEENIRIYICKKKHRRDMTIMKLVTDRDRWKWDGWDRDGNDTSPGISFHTVLTFEPC